MPSRFSATPKPTSVSYPRPSVRTLCLYCYVYRLICCAYVYYLLLIVVSCLCALCCLPIRAQMYHAAQSNQHRDACAEVNTPYLPTEIIPAKICWRWPKISGEIPMDMRIPPLKIQIMLESNPLKSRILVRRLAVPLRSDTHPVNALCAAIQQQKLPSTPWFDTTKLILGATQRDPTRRDQIQKCW